LLGAHEGSKRRNAMQKYEFIIQKGRIIDGTGNPYYVTDIALKNGKIVRIHKTLEPSEARRIISVNLFLREP
jgi:N-acyl-D-aspartate/D-glutamate deacylase